MNKPALTDPRQPGFLPAVKAMLEILTGRRGTRISELHLQLREASASPTQAEFDALAADLVETRQKVNALISLLQG